MAKAKQKEKKTKEPKAKKVTRTAVISSVMEELKALRHCVGILVAAVTQLNANIDGTPIDKALITKAPSSEAEQPGT